MGALGQSFLEFLEQPVKSKICILLVNIVKSNIKTKWANKENQNFP